MQQQETIAELKAQIRDLQLKNEKLSAAAESHPIQDIYINGFHIGFSTVDLSISLLVDGLCKANLKMPPVLGKALAKKFSKMIDDIEQVIGPIQDEDTIVEKLQALQPKPLPGDAQ